MFCYFLAEPAVLLVSANQKRVRVVLPFLSNRSNALPVRRRQNGFSFCQNVTVSSMDLEPSEEDYRKQDYFFPFYKFKVFSHK